MLVVIAHRLAIRRGRFRLAEARHHRGQRLLKAPAVFDGRLPKSFPTGPGCCDCGTAWTSIHSTCPPGRCKILSRLQQFRCAATAVRRGQWKSGHRSGVPAEVLRPVRGLNFLKSPVGCVEYVGRNPPAAMARPGGKPSSLVNRAQLESLIRTKAAAGRIGTVRRFLPGICWSSDSRPLEAPAR